MVPYSNEMNEYNQFMIKYLDKTRDFAKDFRALSESNQLKVMKEINKELPFALACFQNDLYKMTNKH